MTDAPLTLAQFVERGRQLGSSLPDGSVVWLDGVMGAGKTTLAQAIVAGRGGNGVASPTYGLVHRYESRRGDIYHVDCYRLRTSEQAADLDWETLMHGNLLLIEWAERAGSWSPAATHRIGIRVVGDETRALTVDDFAGV